ncbi:MAG: RNA-metabolising metallo-beta-lactamase [Candidatus Daviesbacteria bacterium GW2011_GWF2_38_7]|nr:MAG: RNA-metabolising metallo-beta-lactamase [Candidatus Daviesbacteria bacterium GW2011_GWF2_38_7]
MKSFKPVFKPQFNSSQPLKIIPLGGVGDVTKNMYVYEYGDDIIIVDCGVGFPDEAMPGVDLVIPDISYLRSKIDKIRGIIITHGHEDHIGGLAYIWPELQVPIYTQKLTAGFIRAKFTEHNLPKDKIIEVKFDQKLDLGNFKISFYMVSHSIPDSMGIVIKTPQGCVIHQADFKIDWTPVSGQVTDVGAVAKLGSEGVLLLLIDCLRVEKAGFNKSEKSIEESFEKASNETAGKLLITMTSSNVSRMQQAINVAKKHDRKVAIVGRSFENNFQVSRDLGYLHVPPGIMIAPEAISSFDPAKLLVLIAGAQGQSDSSLTRAANEEHRFIKLREGDSVVFSADPIPSTESAQNALIDSLSRLGVTVYYSAVNSSLHVSGHAALEELRLMVNLIKPKYLFPIGGTYRHMEAFSKMAQDMGYDKKQILPAEDGDIIEIRKDDIKLAGKVEVQNVYVDGLGIGDVGHVVLRDRQKMSEEGGVVVVVSMDSHTGRLVSDVDVISRGFVFEEMAKDLLEDAKRLVKETLEKHTHKSADWRFDRKIIEDVLEKFLYKATERRPLILPIIVEV